MVFDENFKKLNMNNIIFLDGAEQQWIVYWLGIPYLVESSHNGYFYNVLTMDEQSIDIKLEGIILDKFFKMKSKTAKPNEALTSGELVQQ